MPRVDYLCLDGSPFPVTFAEPDDVEMRWVIDREHAPVAMTPLADAVRRLGRPGAEQAYAECGLRLPSTLRREPPRANGYVYVVDEWLAPAEVAPFEEGLTRLIAHQGGTVGVWVRHCLPRVREACAWLEHAPPDTPFAALAERREYAWSHTSVAGVVARRDLRAVAECCEPVVGDRATLVAHELAQGYDNETIATDRALWHLAQMPPEAPDATAVRNQLLATSGGQTTSWSIDHPTAREQPEVLDARLRLLREHSVRDVADVEAEAAGRRTRLVGAIAAQLDTEELRGRFERRVARLASFVPIREARAHWQLTASGAMRRVVRERGRRLVEQQVIDEPDDVFFLTPDEYDAPTGGLGSVVRDRRAEHRRWLAVTAPSVIGHPGPVPATPGVVRGAPGAPGVASGPARVILDLRDAERLTPGDILVTTATSPSWTPLFGIAAAVVTDAGDIVSHVAIAAREYGIPCVVGTDHATVRIADGAVITVDGGAGTVAVAPSPFPV